MNIPKHWQSLPLKSLVLAQKGKKPLKLSRRQFTESVPYLDIEGIEKGIVSNFADPFSSVISKESDIFIVCDGSRSGLVAQGKIGAVGSTIMVLTPLGIDSSYLFYILKSNYEFFNKNTKGSSIPHLDLQLLYELQIPVPPPEEQKDIAKTLEEQLRIYEDEFLNAESEIEKFSKYRSSLINEALSGALTEEWRKNQISNFDVKTYYSEIQTELENIYERKVNEAKVNSTRLPRKEINNKKSNNIIEFDLDLPFEWMLVRLEEITSLITDGTHHTPKYVKSGIPFLSVKNVRPFIINDKELKFITEEEHQQINKRCNPEKGDILYTKIGATYGYAAKIIVNYPFSIFVSLALIKPLTKFLNSDFLEIIMNSDFVYQQAKMKIKGVANPDLHLIEIRDFKIPLMSYKEQVEIVRQINLQFQEIKNLELEATEKLKNISSLQQSIMQTVLLNTQNSNITEGWFEVFLNEIEQKKLAIQTLNMEQKKKEADSLKKLKSNLLERKSILDLLNEAQNNELNIDEVWKNSSFFAKRDVEGFYEELESLVSDKASDGNNVTYTFTDATSTNIKLKLSTHAD